MKEIYDYQNDDSNYRVVITDKTVYSEIKAESEKLIFMWLLMLLKIIKTVDFCYEKYK